jgi:hypothetical protein
MAHNLRTTENAGETTARPGDLTIAELAALLNSEDLSAGFQAYLAALPTADPLEDDAFWLNTGVVTKSAGAA